MVAALVPAAATAVRPRAAKPVPALPSLTVMSLSANRFRVPSVFLLAMTPVLALLIEPTTASMVSTFLNLTSTPFRSMEVSAVILAWVVPADRPSCDSEPLEALASLMSAPLPEVSLTRPSTNSALAPLAAPPTAFSMAVSTVAMVLVAVQETAVPLTEMEPVVSMVLAVVRATAAVVPAAPRPSDAKPLVAGPGLVPRVISLLDVKVTIPAPSALAVTPVSAVFLLISVTAELAAAVPAAAAASLTVTPLITSSSVARVAPAAAPPTFLATSPNTAPVVVAARPLGAVPSTEASL
ncbi:hypothetical protein D3C77_475220 [compost metagenome]